jgi:hypothetical protein
MQDSPEPPKQAAKPQAPASTRVPSIIVAVVIAAVAGLSIWYLLRGEPLLVQGEVAATRDAIDAIKRESDGVTKRIDGLESTYWDQRETQSKQLTAFERHADDVAAELKEVRRDLARATDTAHQIHPGSVRHPGHVA